MPKVFYPSDKTGFMLVLTEEEMDYVNELAIREHSCPSEIIKACFIRGARKIRESLKSPTTLT